MMSYDRPTLVSRTHMQSNGNGTANHNHNQPGNHNQQTHLNIYQPPPPRGYATTQQRVGLHHLPIVPGPRMMASNAVPVSGHPNAHHLANQTPGVSTPRLGAHNPNLLMAGTPQVHGGPGSGNVNEPNTLHSPDESKDGRISTQFSWKAPDKRKRERMNNSLIDLGKLIPYAYSQKLRGKVEKTEIVELAVKYLKHLQVHNKSNSQNGGRPTTQANSGQGDNCCQFMKLTDEERSREYKKGFRECLGETVRYLAQVEGITTGDSFCVRLVNHMLAHLERSDDNVVDLTHDFEGGKQDAKRIPDENKSKINQESVKNEDKGAITKAPAVTVDSSTQTSVNDTTHRRIGPYASPLPPTSTPSKGETVLRPIDVIEDLIHGAFNTSPPGKKNFSPSIVMNLSQRGHETKARSSSNASERPMSARVTTGEKRPRSLSNEALPSQPTDTGGRSSASPSNGSSHESGHEDNEVRSFKKRINMRYQADSSPDPSDVGHSPQPQDTPTQPSLPSASPSKTDSRPESEERPEANNLSEMKRMAENLVPEDRRPPVVPGSPEDTSSPPSRQEASPGRQPSPKRHESLAPPVEATFNTAIPLPIAESAPLLKQQLVAQSAPNPSRLTPTYYSPKPNPNLSFSPPGIRPNPQHPSQPRGPGPVMRGPMPQGPPGHIPIAQVPHPQQVLPQRQPHGHQGPMVAHPGHPPSGPSSTSRPPPPSKGVPGFGLHPSGNYYTPVTIDERSFQANQGAASAMPVLYPVNIMVDFSKNYSVAPRTSSQGSAHGAVLSPNHSR